MQVGTIHELWRHPVKSLGGESVASVQLTRQGVLGDRCWALVDAATGEIRSAKQLPRLLAFRARFAPDATPLPHSYGDAVAAVEVEGPDGARYASRDRDARRFRASRLRELWRFIRDNGKATRRQRGQERSFLLQHAT